MKHVKKSVLLWYSAREMYDLVIRCEDYPRFLKWCDSAEVLEESDTSMTARLGLSYGGVKHKFTTRNVHTPPESVVLQLVDGPFSLLEGTWLFKTIGDPAVDRPACKVDLDMRYGFSSTTLEKIVSPVFDRVVNTLVDSFVLRAEEVYGPR